MDIHKPKPWHGVRELANHAARAIWAIMVRGEVYRALGPVAAA